MENFNSSEIEQSPNSTNLEEQKIAKRDKASKVLCIIGTIFLVIAFIFMCFFASSVYRYILAEGSEQLVSALELIIIYVYFGFIGVLISIISSILNIVAFAISKKQRTFKLIIMIISIVVTLLYTIFYILMSAT